MSSDKDLNQPRSKIPLQSVTFPVHGGPTVQLSGPSGCAAGHKSRPPRGRGLHLFELASANASMFHLVTWGVELSSHYGHESFIWMMGWFFEGFQVGPGLNQLRELTWSWYVTAGKH